MATNATAHPLPVMDILATPSRQDVVEFAVIGADPDEAYTQGDIAEHIDRPQESVRKQLVTENAAAEDRRGPLLLFGVWDCNDLDAKFRHYQVADTDVVQHLQDVNFSGLRQLLETTGRQQLVTFFLEDDGGDAYSKAAVERNSECSYQSVDDHIDVLVAFDVVTTTEGPRGTKYQRNDDSEWLEYISVLNTLLYETYTERSQQQPA